MLGGISMKHSNIVFFERKFPSANMVLIRDKKSTLVDTGFGSDIKETERFIEQAGVPLEALQLIVNTHYHSDHVGGNHKLQKKYGTPIAAHRWDADLVNRQDVEVCSSVWLDQPVESYQINQKLSDDDELDTGNNTWKVLHTPGHTLGHISLYEPEEKILIAGDLFHKKDVGWMNIFREGVSSIQRSMESLERLAQLEIYRAYSGHGPVIDNPLESIDASRHRLEKWLAHPEKVAWHACKRIFSFTLIIKDGLAKEEIDDYLLNCGWFQDFARHSFQLEPQGFISVLLDEMIRSGAARWYDNRLLASAPYKAPDKQWMTQNIKPSDWKLGEEI